MGCISEKIIQGDSDFVETFRDKGSPSLYTAHAVVGLPVTYDLAQGSVGWWTRRINDVLE